MTEIKPALLPLQFVLSLALLIWCLYQVVNNEDVIVQELCRSLTAVSLLIILAAVSNNTIPQKNDPYENQ